MNLATQTQQEHVLNYAGYVDFATVVHENSTGLRCWHRRLTPVPAAGASATSDGNKIGLGVGTGSSSDVVVAVPPSVEARAERASFPGGGGGRGGGSCGGRKPDEATPWLGWDFTAPHRDGVAGGADISLGARNGGGSGCYATTAGKISTTRGKRCCYGASKSTSNASDEFAAFKDDDGEMKSSKAEDLKNRAQNSDKDVDKGSNNGVEDDQEGEEPKRNREYGATLEEREASVNQVIAFQTDRVVRMLDGMF